MTDEIDYEYIAEFLHVFLDWQGVRCSRMHEQVVRKANAFLHSFWPEARKMGLSRKSLVSVHVPPIIIVSLGEDTAGLWDGKTIKVPTVAENAACVHPEYPVAPRDYLRMTIVHEIQHAIDTANTGKVSEKHDLPFKKRLAKLEKTFVPLAA